MNPSPPLEGEMTPGPLSAQNIVVVEQEFPNWSKDFGSGYWTMKPSSLDRLLNLAREQAPDNPALPDLVEALRRSERAISEYYRYQYGGDGKHGGSYDGKPERDGLWKAMYDARKALSLLSAGGVGGGSVSVADSGLAPRSASADSAEVGEGP